MNNFFIWFIIDGDIDPDKKSNYSKNIHDFIFKKGIKLKTKSNAFFYKSNKSIEYINETIIKLSDENIKLIVILLNNNYQGWLIKKNWEFLK